MPYVSLAIGQFALVTSVFMIAGALSPMAAHFSVTTGQAALAIGAFSLSYALLAPVLAVATSRISPKRILLVALACFALANIATVLTSNYQVMIVLRIVAAAADGLYAATASAVAAMIAPPSVRGRLLAVVNSGVTLAFLVGVPVTSAVAQSWGWQAMFLLVAVLAVVACTLIHFALSDVAPPVVASLRQRISVLTIPRMALTLLVTLVSYAGLFTLFNFSETILSRAGISGEVGTAQVLLAFGIAAIFGNVAGGVMADRVGVQAAVLTGLGALALVLVGAPLFLKGPLGALGFFGLMGFFHYVVLTPIQYRVTKLAGDHAGVALALNASATYLGVAIAAQMGGFIVDNFESVTELALMGAALKGAAIVIFLPSVSKPRSASNLKQQDRVFNADGPI